MIAWTMVTSLTDFLDFCKEIFVFTGGFIGWDPDPSINSRLFKGGFKWCFVLPFTTAIVLVFCWTITVGVFNFPYALNCLAALTATVVGIWTLGGMKHTFDNRPGVFWPTLAILIALVVPTLCCASWRFAEGFINGTSEYRHSTNDAIQIKTPTEPKVSTPRNTLSATNTPTISQTPTGVPPATTPPTTPTAETCPNNTWPKGFYATDPGMPFELKTILSLEQNVTSIRNLFELEPEEELQNWHIHQYLEEGNPFSYPCN